MGYLLDDPELAQTLNDKFDAAVREAVAEALKDQPIFLWARGDGHDRAYVTFTPSDPYDEVGVMRDFRDLIRDELSAHIPGFEHTVQEVLDHDFSKGDAADELLKLQACLRILGP